MKPHEHRAIRKSLGLTQGELARVLETSQQSISEIERGLRSPPPRHLLLLEAYQKGFRPSRFKWPA